MQIVLFSTHYQLVCTNLDFSSSSVISYTSKDALLHCKRASFTTQKGVDGKTERKEIDKKNGLPKPLRRRGCERKREDMGGSLSLEGEPPQAPPKEGMCLAGYGMLCVGEIKEEDLKLKIHGLILKGLNFGGQKYALSHTIHYLSIRKFVVYSRQFPHLLIRKFVVFSS